MKKQTLNAKNPEIQVRDLLMASGLVDYRAAHKRFHDMRQHFNLSKFQPILWSHLKEFYQLEEETLQDFREEQKKRSAQNYLLS